MKTLRNHQTNSITALATASRGIINLPTGTGKTLIQSRSISNEIKNTDGESKVYVILSPRILLSNQIMGEVKGDMVAHTQDCQYLAVHSSSTDLEYTALEKELNIPYREIHSTVTHDGIRESYEKAQREKVDLIISGTYHSAGRIEGSGIPVEIVFCDEGHYLVQEQFSWIVAKPMTSKRVYFFTATLRDTPSDEGMGMNNESLFGEILFQESPAAMIKAGEMIRPRMHLVDMSIHPLDDEGDGLAVAEAFKEHRSEIKTGAKMIIVAKDGSDHLDKLANSCEVLNLLETYPSLQIFDISSEHNPRINGSVVKRGAFLTQLQALKDSDEAIIIHYDILSEGIDVPGITGVMPLRSLQKSKFLQTLGRATRLHVNDRKRLYSNSLTSSEINRFVKPYAWLIVPVYGEIGEDLHEEMREMIRELRDFNFNPVEDIVVRQQRGKTQLTPIENVTTPTPANVSINNFAATVMHEIEEEDKAIELFNEQSKIMNMTDDEFWNDLLGE